MSFFNEVVMPKTFLSTVSANHLWWWHHLKIQISEGYVVTNFEIALSLEKATDDEWIFFHGVIQAFRLQLLNLILKGLGQYVHDLFQFELLLGDCSK